MCTSLRMNIFILKANQYFKELTVMALLKIYFIFCFEVICRTNCFENFLSLFKGS